MPVYNKRGILLLPKVIVLNPKDGIIAEKKNLGPGVDKGWEPIDIGWKFKQEDGTYLTNAWRQDSNGKWYYFSVTSATPLWRYDLTTGRWIFDPKSNGRPYGAMYQNIQTPDGYYVDENGAWDGREAKIR